MDNNTKIFKNSKSIQNNLKTLLDNMGIVHFNKKYDELTYQNKLYIRNRLTRVLEVNTEIDNEKGIDNRDLKIKDWDFYCF